MKTVIGHDENEIDRILSREDEILPSSGFAASVMDAVRREAAAPPPIPFPWKRAVPGLVAGIGALILVLVACGSQFAAAVRAPQLSTSVMSGMPSMVHGGMQAAVIWTGVALVLAFVSVKVATRVT